MFFAIHICIDQPACNKLAFHHVHLQALFCILFIYGQFFLRKYGIGKHFLHEGQQDEQVFTQAMQGYNSCFIIATAAAGSPVIIKCFIDRKSRFPGCAVLQHEVGCSRHPFLLFIGVAGIKYPFHLHHFLATGMYGIYGHPVVQVETVIGL